MQIPLRLFIQMAINNFDGRITIQSQELIAEIKKEDPRQELIVVEQDPNSNLTILWRRSDWDLVQSQIEVRHKGWAERKAVWDRQERNIRNLTMAVIKQTGMDMETAKVFATKIVTRQPKKALAFDVTLEV